MADAYGFGRRDVERIGRAVRKVEGTSLGGDPGRGRYPIVGGGVVALRLARTGATIASGGVGTVTYYTWGSHTILGTTTGDVENPWPDNCPGNRKALIGTVNGVPNSLIVWSCNPA
jgi:hypothetical protein